jgi:hypothetical protein
MGSIASRWNEAQRPKEGLPKWIKRISMKGRDVACAEQAGTGWDEENVDTDEISLKT